MLTIEETIVVEGKYDRMKLIGLVHANILEAGGFSVFSDKGKIALLRTLAKKRGLIVFCDSDRAGFQIRNYIKGAITEGVVKHAYIPDIPGKEKRKAAPSKEGLLGVEGVADDVIIEALKKAGASVSTTEPPAICMYDLYEDGLNGRADSKKKRQALLRDIELPERLSTKGLLSVLNALYSYAEYKELAKRV